ncbi:Heavy-metal-associated domain [Musa troglodytarum]|uniref:Heavy-metal-associated domain n=1 Tax=Musa troglodytarum TaxID=320322 RepID=A0A9E7G7P4_9LILI|nr:Heavy-metal-associated domain [Musa troglodytarum]
MGEAKQEAEAKQEEKKEEMQEEKKEEKAEEKKEVAKTLPPPPVVLSVDLHCVGCAKKIEKSILKCRGFTRSILKLLLELMKNADLADPHIRC